MDLVQQLKTINADRADADELMALASQGRALQATYEAEKFPVPAWLSDANATLTTEVKRRRKDQLELAVKQARQRVDSLKSAEQKRAEAADELAKLEAMLAESA